MLSFFCYFNDTKHLIKVEFTLKHINSFSLHFASVLYYNCLSTHCKLDIHVNHFVCLISVFMQLENKICKEKIKLYILYNGARLNWTFLRQAISDKVPWHLPKTRGFTGQFVIIVHPHYLYFLLGIRLIINVLFLDIK
jgi:hypothetical protein